MIIQTALALFLSLTTLGNALAKPAFSPAIGTQIDLSLPLSSDGAAPTALRDIMGNKPALVLFGYYRCPNLCDTSQTTLAYNLGNTDLAKDDYRVLFVTVDPQETAEEARMAQADLAQSLGAETASPWHFLSGANVVALAENFGVTSEQRDRIQQIVHPVGVIALTADGKISRALPGLGFTPQDVRLAVVEASQGKLGSLVDHIFLFCAGFDETRGQYTAPVQAGLRWGGLLILLLLGGAILLLRRERQR